MPIIYMSYYVRNTSHSVNFENTNILFDLTFTRGNLINDVSLGDLSFVFFDAAINDASSNASAVIEVQLSSFNELFKIRVDPQINDSTEMEYFVDDTGWNNQFIMQEPVEFSGAEVQSYDGSLNRGPIDPSHCIQSIKRDMLRHIYNSIPNVEYIDDINQFQMRILRMIEHADSCLHTKIKNILKSITDLGYQSYDDTSLNPLRVLIGSTYDEYDEFDASAASTDKISQVSASIFAAIDAHTEDVKNYAYYVIDAQNKFHGPLFMDKTIALVVSDELSLKVDFSNELVGGMSVLELSFNTLSSYVFYAIPGTDYTSGSYDVYDSFADIEANQVLLVTLDKWNGSFTENAQYLTMGYPFAVGDQLSLLVEYSGEYLDSVLFNTLTNGTVDTRTYQIFLKFI
jgi:hypothetical protein